MIVVLTKTIFVYLTTVEKKKTERKNKKQKKQGF